MDPNSPQKKKGPAPDAQTCANCLAVLGRAGVANLKCARCGLVAYCSKDCQRAHWKANHKQFCVAKTDRIPPPTPPIPEKAETANSERRRAAASKAAAADEECAICLRTSSTQTA